MTEDIDSDAQLNTPETVDGESVVLKKEQKFNLTEKGKQWIVALKERFSKRGGSRGLLEDIASSSSQDLVGSENGKSVENLKIGNSEQLENSDVVEEGGENIVKEAEKGLVGGSSFEVHYPDTGERHIFEFNSGDFEELNANFTADLNESRTSSVPIEGCMDREGRVWWKKDEKGFPTHMWNNLTGRPNVVIFDYEPEKNRLSIQSSNDGATNALVSFFDRNNREDYEINVWRLRNTAVIRLAENKYIGKRQDWSGGEEKFVRDRNISKTEGYEPVKDEDVENRINDLYENARKRGKYLVIRTVGIPVEPKGLSSASLLSPNHTDVFDARIGDYDKGGLIYEVDESSVPLSFNQDAATWVFSKDKSPDLKQGQDVKEYGDKVIYYDKSTQPLSLRDLHEKAINKETGSPFYSEVVIDTDNPTCKLVAVVNPYDVQGWSKIAYRRGVPEFFDTPELDQKKRKAEKGQRLKNDE